MNSFTRLAGFTLLLLMIAALACEDDKTVAPPDPAPQIGVVYRYTKNPDPTDTQKGLQSNETYDIIVDHTGKTWVATQEGASRFDGPNGAGAFDHNSVLPNPKCRALLEHNNKIWIGTAGGGVGIYDIDEDSWTHLDTDSLLINNQVWDIAADGQDLYFGTANGVAIYTDDDQLDLEDRWSYFRPTGANRLKTAAVSVIAIAETPTRGKEIWYGPRYEDLVEEGDENMNGITVQREGLTQPIYYTMATSGLREPNVNDIYYDVDTDLFWVAFSRSGLATVDVDGSTWTYYTMRDGLPSDVIYSIAKINGIMWVGTQRGVARMKADGKFAYYGVNGGLPDARVRKIYSDTPNRMWTCFVGAGAALLNPASAE